MESLANDNYAKHFKIPIFKLNDIELLEQKWLLDDLIPEKEVTVIHGDGGLGKSALLAALVVRVAAGTEAFLGKTLKSDLPSLWLDGEMGKEAYRRRMRWALNAININEETIQNRALYMDLRPKTLTHKTAITEVGAHIKHLGIGLLVIDSYEAVIGNGIDAEAVGKAHRQLAEFGTTTIIIDHHAKSGDEGGGKKAYGSVYKYNFARSDITLSRKSLDGVNYITIHQGKTNDGEEEPDLVIERVWNVDKNDFENGILDFKVVQKEGIKWADKSSNSTEDTANELLMVLKDGMTSKEWMKASDSLMAKSSFYKYSAHLNTQGAIVKKGQCYYHSTELN